MHMQKRTVAQTWALQAMGLHDASYWLSWHLYQSLMALLFGFFIWVFGMIFQFRLFLRNGAPPPTPPHTPPHPTLSHRRRPQSLALAPCPAPCPAPVAATVLATVLVTVLVNRGDPPVPVLRLESDSEYPSRGALGRGGGLIR